MSRISSRVGGTELTAIRNVNAAFAEIAAAGLQLSTLKRINRASDDPAGLIAAEQLRSELESLEAASRSSARATAAVSLADSGLSQITGLLNTVESRVLEAAGGNLSDAELAANQLEIDSALEAIDRIGAYTGLSDGGRISFAPTGDVNDVAGLDLPTISRAALGSDEVRLGDVASGGSASLARRRYEQAIGAVSGAREQVLSARARLGAFERNTIDASREFVAGLQETLSESLSRIEDADLAVATARMVRGEVLGKAAVASLRTLSQSRSLIQSLLDETR